MDRGNANAKRFRGVSAAYTAKWLTVHRTSAYQHAWRNLRTPRKAQLSLLSALDQTGERKTMLTSMSSG